MSQTQSPVSSRLSTPEPAIPVQPAHFYPPTQEQPTKGPKGYWDPEDDPLATRGIPVFQPSIDEFNDFEGFMEKVECWGSKSGIVKIVPPKEWRETLDPLVPLLSNIRIRNAIEQHMNGSEGMFHQKNMEKRRTYSVREWAQLCMETDLRAPTRDELGRNAGANGTARSRGSRSTRASKANNDHVTALEEAASRLPTPAPEANDPAEEAKEADTPGNAEDISTAKSEPAEEEEEEELAEEGAKSLPTPPGTVADSPGESHDKSDEKGDEKPDAGTSARSRKRARLEARMAQDEEWLKTFDPETHWLPPGLKSEDYTPEFCQLLEKLYWRSCGLQGKKPMYGADLEGSLFTDKTKHWNVAHLPSALERLLPASNKKLPGVNTPYLYWGMWRATFAWHVEDMDLFSINYIHHGAPKHWYAIPQGKAASFEQSLKGIFPGDSRCPQFLRHKAFLVSPTRLARTGLKPNTLVHRAGEFVVTFPRGYHAGFNMGFNCAESVNFALESWIELGKNAKVCRCVGDSVAINVSELLELKENPPPEPAPEDEEMKQDSLPSKPKPPKRKSETTTSAPNKKPKPSALAGGISATTMLSTAHPVTLKLPAPEVLDLPCCLCVGLSREDLLPVHDPPKASVAAGTRPGKEGWKAHRRCAKIVPETWVDEEDGREYIYGVDAIVRDRWNLKCNACTKIRMKAHGAPIQCTKGKCPKAFHVSCANDDPQVEFRVIEEVEKQVIIVEVEPPMASFPPPPPPAVPSIPPIGDTSVPMDVDPSVLTHSGALPSPAPPAPAETAEPKVVKSIWKSSYELLCPQHNPTVIAARKTEKIGAAKEQLTKLLTEPNPRIRIRNSSGTFEVTLVSMDEQCGTVIVLWDGNVQREFRWGSIVWGNEGKEGVSKSKDASATSAAPKTQALKSNAKKKAKPQPTQTPSASASTSTSTSMANGMYYPPPPGYYSAPTNAAYPAYTAQPGYSYGYPYPYYYSAYVASGGKAPTTNTALTPYPVYPPPPPHFGYRSAYTSTITASSTGSFSAARTSSAPSRAVADEAVASTSSTEMTATPSSDEPNKTTTNDGLTALSEAAVSTQIS